MHLKVLSIDPEMPPLKDANEECAAATESRERPPRLSRSSPRPQRTMWELRRSVTAEIERPRPHPSTPDI